MSGSDDVQSINTLLPALKLPNSLERSAEVGEFVFEVGTAIGGVLFPPATIITWVIGYLLGGYADGRKFQRIVDFVNVVNERLTKLENKSVDYMKSEEFIDLTEEVIERVGKERNASKRQMYGQFLTDAIASPSDSYDEQLRFLRTLEQLQGDHLHILKALLQVPDTLVDSKEAPTILQILQARLPVMNAGHIIDLVRQLNDLRVVNLKQLHDVNPGATPESLRRKITSYGKRFTKYLQDD